MKFTCMSCKYYKIKNALSGYCRVEKKEPGDQKARKPMMPHDNSCQKWVDCGQQYYIRRGWLKAQKPEK